MSFKYTLSLLICLCLAFTNRVTAQLVVNEFSQGASGNKEYIELVVKGTRTCNDSCADIRGWMFDDNNGWYGTTAISPGSFRFKNDPNWSCVPYGAIIVIYNGGDINGSLPADDPTDANNDNVYVLPIASNYLEMHNTLPSGTSMNYPASGWGPSTTWTNLALNNTNDAVQVVDPANLTVAYHAVSYGSAVVAPVHIGSSGSQKVYYLSSGLYNSSAAWLAGNVPGNETPGQPNSAGNATWINGMLNGAAGGVSSNDTIDVTLCQGDSTFFNGNYYNSTGFQTVTFTSGSGCDSVVTLNLVVHPIPAVPVVVSPLNYCQDDTAVALTAAGANLLWYDVPAGGAGSNTAPVPQTGVPGTITYYVSQVVAGCESARDSIEVKVIPKPLPPIVTPSIVVCQGTPPLTLTAQGQNLLWYTLPLGGTGTNTSPVVPTNAGLLVTWYVSQTVNGCESVRIPVTVKVSAIKADFTLSVDTLCIKDSLVTNNLSVGNDYINHWDFGDGFTYVNINQAHQYTVPGIYTVALAIANSDGCKDTARQRIWVSPQPDIRVTQDAYNICTGDAVNFNLEYLQGFAILTWNFGDGNLTEQLDDRDHEAARGVLAGKHLRHAYDQAGKYFFTTSAYTPGCGLKEWNDSVIVHATPLVDLGPDTSLCLHGAPVILKNRFPVPEVARYVWSTGETTSEIQARHHGDISLTVNTDYCSNTDIVHIAKDCYIDVPNAFTPNGDGANDYFFPRQMLASSVSSFHLQVLSRWGQQVYETTRLDGRGWDGRFNNTDQPGGVYVYLIKVSFANGASEAYQGNVTLIR